MYLVTYHHWNLSVVHNAHCETDEQEENWGGAGNT